MNIVKICHARGGGPTAPGDQTGREVCAGVWWAGGWTVLLRPKSPATAEGIAQFAELAAANENVGYSQADRNSLRAQARAKGFHAKLIDVPCNCDCSSFASVCAEAAGALGEAQYSYGNAPWTGNMREKFSATGNFEVLTDVRYLTSPDYLKRGDVLVNEPQATGHAVVVTSDGDKAAYAPATPQTANDTAAADKPVTSSHKTHTVQWGDTLWDIANTYGTTVEKICQLNELNPEKFIYPGQVVVIPN